MKDLLRFYYDLIEAYLMEDITLEVAYWEFRSRIKGYSFHEFVDMFMDDCYVYPGVMRTHFEHNDDIKFGGF